MTDAAVPGMRTRREKWLKFVEPLSDWSYSPSQVKSLTTTARRSHAVATTSSSATSSATNAKVTTSASSTSLAVVVLADALSTAGSCEPAVVVLMEKCEA